MSPHLPRLPLHPPHNQIFSFSTAVILKTRSGSPKSNQFFIMSHISMKIWKESSYWFTRYCTDKKVSRQCRRHQIFSYSAAVTLKICSRSPKSNQLFILSQLYIHENLERLQPLVHKILCRPESLQLTSKGSVPKTIYLPPHWWLGHKHLKENEYTSRGGNFIKVFCPLSEKGLSKKGRSNLDKTGHLFKVYDVCHSSSSF